MMIKQYSIPNLILKMKFKDHKKYKKELLNLIKKSNDKNWNNKDSYYNDKLLKTDWPEANNWERPWIKLIGDSLFKSLENCAQVFLHYNNKATKDSSKNLFDGRIHLGLPKIEQFTND